MENFSNKKYLDPQEAAAAEAAKRRQKARKQQIAQEDRASEARAELDRIFGGNKK